MAESPQSDPANPDPASRGSFSRALLVALMVAVLYGAILLAVDGYVSLLTNHEIISESDAGPLVGPVMAVTALAIVFCSILFGLRPSSSPPRIPIAGATVTGALVFVLSPLAGAIMYVLGKAVLGSAIRFFLHYLASPFVVTSAVLAAVAVLLLPGIARARSRAR